MKKNISIIFYILCILFSASCKNKITFSLITDTKIPHAKDNLITALKDNVLVAKEDEKEIARYYSSNGNILSKEMKKFDRLK